MKIQTNELIVIRSALKFERNKDLFKTEEYKDMKLNIVKSNRKLLRMERVSPYITRSQSERLIIRTKREKRLFETIFLPCKSAELTYTIKAPVLIYSK